MKTYVIYELVEFVKVGQSSNVLYHEFAEKYFLSYNAIKIK